MTDSFVAKRELERCRENLKNSNVLFESGSDAAIDLIAGAIRTICNWSTEERNGYQSLLRQTGLVSRIRFPCHPDFWGCEVSGLHFYLIDGIDFRCAGKTPFMRLGSFSITSSLAEVRVENGGQIFMSGMDLHTNIPGMNCNLQLLPLSLENSPISTTNSLVEGVWRTIGISRQLRQPFIDWWATSKVLCCNGKSYSRQELIDYVANKSGGAHVSPRLDSESLYQYERDKFAQLKNIKILSSGLHKTVQVIGLELLEALNACAAT